MTSKLNINWLNKCRCGNRRHTVETVRGSHVRLFEDDAVKCNSCGRDGVIQTCDGIATVLWETDEERAEGVTMAKSTITREQLEEWVEQFDEDGGCDATDRQLEALIRQSLAVMDSEPVVPEEMPCGGAADDYHDGYQDGWNACRAAMLAAAPQSPGSEPATVPGKWIPVSERMPDDDDFVYIWPRPDFGVELHVGQYCERSHKGGGWYAQVYEQNYGIEWHPITVTHWMPLPAAPQEVK